MHDEPVLTNRTKRKNGFRNSLRKYLEEYGFTINETQIKQFVTYRNELKRWNRKINLTTIVDDHGIIVKHFLDSLSILCCFSIPKYAKIADVGTGAGFPGLPIKIYRPDVQMCLIEASKKKTSFLKYLLSILGLKNIEVANARAEELIKLPAYNSQYDLVLTRYIASIGDSVEYCLPLLKSNGMLIAYKSYDIESELREAMPKLRRLGAVINDIIESEITGIRRTFVSINKA
ncbi:MAG: 16S rRNA (guanine(527)-N(7))-methyltransferase RsmG [Candidatus Poribacteria bacterium]